MDQPRPLPAQAGPAPRRPAAADRVRRPGRARRPGRLPAADEAIDARRAGRRRPHQGAHRSRRLRAGAAGRSPVLAHRGPAGRRPGAPRGRRAAPGWSPRTASTRTSLTLADFFDTPLQEFVAHVGGAGTPRTPTPTPTPTSGSGSARPSAVVAEPILTGPGLHGPARVERGRAASVLLRRRDALRRLSPDPPLILRVGR